MTRTRKQSAGPAAPIIALKPEYEVEQFSEYHFRVNGTFDVWLPKFKWHNRMTDKRGTWNGKDMPNFVKQQIAQAGPAQKRTRLRGGLGSGHCLFCRNEAQGFLCDGCRNKSWAELMGMSAPKEAN